MRFDDLAPDSQVTLCLQAEQVCLRRIREIERRSDPADASLRRLLQDIESHAHSQLDRVAEIGSPSALENPEDVEAHFPSARERLGEGPLDRDNAMYYLESLKEEASRFFQGMAQAALNDRARELFTRIALGELGQVVRLRSVLL